MSRTPGQLPPDRLPGWGPPPPQGPGGWPPGPGGWPPGPGGWPPGPPPRRNWLWALVLGVLLVVTVVVLSLVVFTGGDDDDSAAATPPSKTKSKTSAPRSTTSAPTQPKPTTPSPAPANVDPGSLPRLLSSAADISSVMSTPGMIADPVGSGLVGGSSSTAPPGCTAVWAPADQPTYAATGLTASAVQTVRQEPKTTTAAVQAIVAFADERAAKAAADQVVAAWERCKRTEFQAPIAGREVTFKSGVVGTTDGTSTLLIFSRGQLDSPGTSPEPNCQRAVTPRKNVVVDVLACSPKLGSEGFTIARDIGARITGTR